MDFTWFHPTFGAFQLRTSHDFPVTEAYTKVDDYIHVGREEMTGRDRGGGGSVPPDFFFGGEVDLKQQISS